MRSVKFFQDKFLDFFASQDIFISIGRGVFGDEICKKAAQKGEKKEGNYSREDETLFTEK